MKPVKKINKKPPRARATVRCLSGPGRVIPNVAIKLSTRNSSTFIPLLTLSRMSAEDKPQDLIDPGRAALDQPHTSAEELEEEIGDSEPWDEASQESEE